MRRWLFVHVKGFSASVALIVTAMVVAAFWAFPTYFHDLSHRVDTWLAKFGLGMESLLAQLVVGALLVPLLGFIVLKLLPRLVVFACRVLLPVNRHLESPDVERVHDYQEKIWAELLNRLDRDIYPTGTRGRRRLPKQLIPLEAEEIPTEHNGGRSSRIKNILSFLDAEFFLTPDSRVPLMMVEGEPGAGKSTVFFELFRQLRLRFEQRKFGWIPVLIFADRMTEDMLFRAGGDHPATFEGFLENYHRDGRSGPKEFQQLLQLVPDAQYAVIIDGLDEFSDTNRYTAFAASLNKVLASADSRHRIIVSCRKEDNEGAIRGRLVRIKPLTERQIIGQLKRAVVMWTGKHSPERRALEGLRQSRNQRLLRNYVSNPYLLKLIVSYYREQTSTPKLANALDKVFEEVLTREVQKKDSGPGGRRDATPAQDIARFLKDLLGPYCYERSFPRLWEAERKGEAWRDLGSSRLADHLRENTELAPLLFGTGERPGYLRLKHKGDRSSQSDAEQMALIIGARWPGEWFSKLVDWINKAPTEPTYEKFESAAIEYLYHLAFELLKEAKLASIENNQIQRMRHRRMQHYFMAVHVDRVGLEACPEFRKHIANSWLREPLRILAAVGTRPGQVLDEFATCYDGVTVTEASPALEAIENRCNILGNAAAFISYLPAQQNDDTTGAQLAEAQVQELLAKITDFGLRVQTLYHALYARDVVDELSVAKAGPLMSRDACLKALAEIYASEFVCADHLKSRISGIFGGHQGRAEREKNSWWVLHRWHMRQSAYFQRLVYRSFYRIRSRHPLFPVGTFAVFLYAFDGVLFSSNEYRTLIRDTHVGWRERGPAAIARWCVNLTSAALAIAPGVVLWWVFGASFLGMALMILLCVVLVIGAYAVQAHHLLDKGDAYKVLPWLASRLFKKLWARRGMRKEYVIETKPVPLPAGASAGGAGHAPMPTGAKQTPAAVGSVPVADSVERGKHIAFMLAETEPSVLIDTLVPIIPNAGRGWQRYRRLGKLAFSMGAFLAVFGAALWLSPSVAAIITEVGLRSDVANAGRTAKEVGAQWRASGTSVEGEAFAQLQRACESAKAKIAEVAERVNKDGPSGEAKRVALLAELKNAMAELPAEEEVERRQAQLMAQSRVAIFKTEVEDLVLQAKVLLQSPLSTAEGTLRDNQDRESKLATSIRNLLTEGRGLNGVALGHGETANLGESLERLGEIESRIAERSKASSQRLAEIEGARKVSAFLANSLPAKEKAAALIGQPLLGLDQDGLKERSDASDKLTKELQASVIEGESILGLSTARADWPEIQSRIADLRQSMNGLEDVRARVATRLTQLKAADDEVAFERDWKRLQHDFRNSHALQKASPQEQVRAFKEVLGQIESAQAQLEKSGMTEQRRVLALAEMQTDARRRLAMAERESYRAKLLDRAARLITEVKRLPSENDGQDFTIASTRAKKLLQDLQSTEKNLKNLQDSQTDKLLAAIAESQRSVIGQVANLNFALQTAREQNERKAQKETYLARSRALRENESLAKLRKDAVAGAALQRQRLGRLQEFQKGYSGDLKSAGFGWGYLARLWRYNSLASPVEQDLIESASFSANAAPLLAELKAFQRQADGLMSDPLSHGLDQGEVVKLLGKDIAAEVTALEQLSGELKALPQDALDRNARVIRETVRRRLLELMVLIVCVVAIFYAIRKVRTSWGDKKGLAELGDISERPDLIKFLNKNTYSARVTEVALNRLNAMLPPPGPKRDIARGEIDVLWKSFEQRFGEIDNETTRRLHQILDEIGSRLGHQAPPAGPSPSEKQNRVAQAGNDHARRL